MAALDLGDLDTVNIRLGKLKVKHDGLYANMCLLRHGK